jgi:hypothetical protein
MSGQLIAIKACTLLNFLMQSILLLLLMSLAAGSHTLMLAALATHLAIVVSHKVTRIVSSSDS